MRMVTRLGSYRIKRLHDRLLKSTKTSGIVRVALTKIASTQLGKGQRAAKFSCDTTTPCLEHVKSLCLIHVTSLCIVHIKSLCLVHVESLCLVHAKPLCLVHVKSLCLVHIKSLC